MSQRLWEALAARLTGAVQSPACSSLAGVAASLWPLPLPAFSLLHALQPPQVLSSRRNFFEHKSLGAGPWFSSQACLSSRCGVQRSCLPRFLSLLSSSSFQWTSPWFPTFLAHRHMPRSTFPWFLHLQELTVLSLPMCSQSDR